MTNDHLHKEAIKSEIGKKVLSFLITNTNRKKLSRYRKDRARTRMIRALTGEQESHLDDILRNILKHLTPVTQPPVLISQIHHAGGSLLNRLFDGHPEINALPHEIRSGATATGPGPGIDLANSAQDWFEIQFKEVDTTVIRKKFGEGDADSKAIPFVFLPLIQEQLFLKYLDTRETIQQRDVIDAYITSCFGAWLDYQNLSGDKKFTTACAPDLATQPDSMERFFEIYPEGRVISLVRNPEDWLACVRTHEPEIYENARSAVSLWKKSVRTVLEINRKFGDRVRLIRFEDLMSRTDAVMSYLSEFLEISFDNILLKPTFNSMPLKSSEDRQTDISDVASGYAFESNALDENHRALIEEMTQDDFQKILREVAGF
jgi:hypothetical protein